MAVLSLLLHVNKLILSTERCLLPVHTAPWKASFLTMPSKSMRAERHSSLCHVPYLRLAGATADLLHNLEPYLGLDENTH